MLALLAEMSKKPRKQPRTLQLPVRVLRSSALVQWMYESWTVFKLQQIAVPRSWVVLTMSCKCHFVMAGSLLIWVKLPSAGAAGNFLASINQLSANAFKSVIDIDVLGSYNTLKATIPYLVESAKKHRMDPETRKWTKSRYSR